MQGGNLRHGEAKWLNLFLTLENLGVAGLSYPKSILAARRRDAVKLGFSVSESGDEPIKVQLGRLLEPYERAVGASLAA